MNPKQLKFKLKLRHEKQIISLTSHSHKIKCLFILHYYGAELHNTADFNNVSHMDRSNYKSGKSGIGISKNFNKHRGREINRILLTYNP